MSNTIDLKFDYFKIKSKLYLGEFGEQLVRLTFTINEIETFFPLIDDRAVDFIARSKAGNFYEVQVKTIRLKKSRYFYETKKKWGERMLPNFLVALVILQENNINNILLIPGNEWKKEAKINKIFSDRDYVGKKSDPEWGLELNQKNMPYLIEKFDLNKTLNKLLAT